MKKITKIEAKEAQRQALKLKVAAYVRVSTTSNDQLDSLATQEKHYAQVFEEHHEWQAVGIYSDEGISGTTTTKREGLLHLIEDCRQGKIDLVLTKSISRLSRNLVDCLEIVRELSELNVAIHFDKENLNTQQMDGELLLSTLSALAESESSSISENAKWGFRKRVENGTYKHVSPAYGYDIVDGELVINKKEAVIVQAIFQWYLNGSGTYVIAKKLNEQGVGTSKNTKWRDNSVQYILMNERYVGDALLQKTYTDSQFKRHQNNMDVDMLYISNSHEALIGRKDFERVQEILEERNKQLGNKGAQVYGESYLFSGKLKCQKCGGNFKRRIHYISKKRSYIAWTCSNRLKDNQLCSIKYLKENNVQEAFITMMNKLIFGRKEILEQTIQQLSQLEDRETVELQALEAKLQKIQEQLQSLSDLLEVKMVEATFYLKEEQTLQQKKKHYLEKKRRLLRDTHQYAEQLKEMKELNRVLSKREYLTHCDEDLFDRYVKRISVYERNQIGFELTCGLIPKERVRI